MSSVGAVLQKVGVILAVSLTSGFVCAVSMVRPELAAALVLVLAVIDGALLPPVNRMPRGTWALFFGSLLFWMAFAWAGELDRAIVHSPQGGENMGAIAIVILPPLAAMLAFIGSSVVVALAAWAPRAVPALARGLAVVAGVAAVVLGPIAVVRAVTRPVPSRYVESLPVVAVVEAVASDPSRAAVDCRRDYDLGDVVLRLYCETAISVLAKPAPDASPVPVPPFAAPGASSVVVRRDHARGYVLVRSGNDTTVFTTKNSIVGIDPIDVASSIAPPLAATVLGVVAVLLALGGGAWTLRKRRQAARLLAAPEATVDPSGWLSGPRDAGVEPVRVEHVRPGTVIVLGTQRGDAYRGAGRADVVPTSHAEVRADLRAFEDQLASALAIAIPAAVLPLVVAALRGLLL